MEKSKKPNDSRDILIYKKNIADATSYIRFWDTYARIGKQTTESFDDRRELLNELSDIFLYLQTDIKKANLNNESIDNNNEDNLDLIEITKKLVDELYPQSEKNKKENIISTETKSKSENNQVKQDNTGLTKVLDKYYSTIKREQLCSLGMYGPTVLENQIKSFHELDDDQKIKLLRCMKHVKNNQLTNDDLSVVFLFELIGSHTSDGLPDFVTHF